MFIEDLSLWGCVWQSTLFAAIGLAVSLLFRSRPARAFQVLILTMSAAVLLPAMSVLVKHFELGVLAQEPTVIKQKTSSNITGTDYETTMSAASFEAEREVNAAAAEGTPARAGAKRAAIPWRTMVLWGWKTAALILSGRLGVGFIGGILLLRRAQANSSKQIRQAADSAREKLGAAEELQVRSSGEVKSPVIWCWSKNPVLLVPDNTDSEVDWAGVICHELAHFRRKDHISVLIAELIVCVLPWNPLLWWSKKRLVILSEQACDDWVLATGEPCEDYAQTLLNFSPQKQAVFVPAVVSSKKTLCGRVRRILEGNSINPHSGSAWAAIVSFVTLTTAVGIAFAQARASKQAGTIRTKVGKCAVIEEPAFPTPKIKGRILDPNNEPAYGANIVALPVTSWGYRTEPAARNKEGYFELPWSPTWIEQDGRIYLMAVVQDPTSQAALVEVKDPTSPVIVRLEPAFAISGQVVDPDGQRIEECRATISLATEFKCRAPIYCFRGGKWWDRILSPLPYGTKYELTVQA
jgi:beta-lactamase regulating signal transducer with metallopeptidase domain